MIYYHGDKKYPCPVGIGLNHCYYCTLPKTISLGLMLSITHSMLRLLYIQVLIPNSYQILLESTTGFRQLTLREPKLGLTQAK